MTAAIEVQGLRKSYGAVVAVDDVSLTVQQGEIFGILGPNGAGKTTLLEMCEGLRRPDAGEIRVLGERPWPRNGALLPRLGVQLQASAFFDLLTTHEQIHTFAALYGVPGARADEWLERVGLTEHASVRSDQLSGGQRQRLAIACALVHEPELVFLDEPTAGVDPQARRNLWDLLLSLNEAGRTLVLTSHHLDEAESLCDRVAIMDHGVVLTTDSPAALVRAMDAPTRLYVAAGQIDASRVRGLEGVDSVVEEADSVVLSTREPARVLADLAALDALEGLQVRGATLEDVFLDLTGREYRS